MSLGVMRGLSCRTPSCRQVAPGSLRRRRTAPYRWPVCQPEGSARRVGDVGGRGEVDRHSDGFGDDLCGLRAAERAVADEERTDLGIGALQALTGVVQEPHYFRGDDWAPS